MPRITDKQKLAVDKSNTNIIVSAGAGSGKTTVLKTRVERLLSEGVNINELIILTFTNPAAAEMKDRIRKVIKNNKDISDMEEYVDSAYITTFDSFAQSMVKKYANVLNMNDKFTIIDANIVSLEIDKIIDDIFEELYFSFLLYQSRLELNSQSFRAKLFCPFYLFFRQIFYCFQKY